MIFAGSSYDSLILVRQDYPLPAMKHCIRLRSYVAGPDVR